jgi:hypothetical protein
MYIAKSLGDSDNIDITESSQEKISKEDQKSSFFPLAIFIGGTFLTLFLLRNWFPEGRFND